MRKTPGKMLLLGIALLGLTALASAQVPGLPSWGTFAGGKVDSIDVANLQVRFTIPVFHRTGVGINLDVPLILDNQDWQPSAYPETWMPDGMSLVPPGVGGFVGADATVYWCTDANYNDWSYTVYNNYVYVDPSGVIHPLANASNGSALYTQDSDPCNLGGWPYQANGIASDGSGYTAVVDDGAMVSAASATGVQYTPTSATDRNGNNIHSTDSDPYPYTQDTTSYFDTLSSSVAAFTEVNNSSTHTITYSYTNPGGTQSSYVEKLQQFTLQTHLGCPNISEDSQSVYLPYELDLPDGTKYTIAYETTPTYGAGYTTGRVSQITLPTGGSITYSYTVATSGTQCGQLTGLARTVHVGSAANQTTYTAGGGYTTITDPSGNVTVDTFNGTLLTEKQVYQGSSALLETEQFCYNGTVANCTGTAFSTIDDEVEMPVSGGGTMNRHTLTVMDATAGAPSEVQESDWASSGEGGGWLRQTFTQFDPTYPGLPDTVTVETGGGAEASKTAYYRGTNGNPSSIGYSYSTSNALSRSFTYNANGTVASATGVNGQTTHYTYGDCNGAFPTEVDEPNGLKRNMSWDCNGGVQLTATDENGGVSTWTYQDSNYWRPTQVEDVDQDVTQLAYGIDAGAWNVTSTMTFNSGSSVAENRTEFDGLGRPVLSQRSQSPSASSWDSVETQYDAEGRASQVSMPYSAAKGALSGSAWTAATFDALGRPLTVTDAGHGETTYAYSGNATTVTQGDTGSGQKFARRMTYDGLGMLAFVCEQTSAAGSGACGSGGPSGYETEYSRNPRGQITGVWENMQGGLYQYRSFVFDELGRMLSETTPEAGTTTFSYGLATANCPASTGNLVQRQDAAGNITCYAHDALQRLTEVSYPVVQAPFVSTPARYFVYDSASGFPGQNTAGRLAEAYTAGSATLDYFSYDHLGNTIATSQQSPGSAGAYVSSETYYPNGVPKQLTLPGSGMPGIAYSVDGEGRPTLVSATAGQNPVTAAAYGDAAVPGAPTSITLSGSVDSYAFDDSTGRMTSYSFAAAAGTDAGALTWNANGTLKTLAIADDIPTTTDTQTCNYGYDDLARLASANCGANWSQTFNYDPFGNISSGGSESFGASYTPGSGVANNRIVTNINFSNPNYDADGDLQDDPVSTARNVNTFDAEGRPTKLEGVAVTYDALGRAVEAGSKEILYAPDGHKIAVMSGQTAVKDYVALPGGGTAVYASGALSYYTHADWEGSARLETNTSGGLTGAAAYSPYGYVYDQVGTFEASFTGQRQEIDAAASGGQYSFLMRNQNPTQGRWWRPDPAGLGAVDPANPQSWNAYAYVGGQPLTATDPLGLLQNTNPPPFCNQWICDPDFQQVYCFEYGVCDPWSPPPSGPADSGGGIDTGEGPTSQPGIPLKDVTCPSAAALDRFLKGSPLAGEGADFMAAGEEYGVDPRFVVGLADAESSLGRNITRGAYNAWNWMYNLWPTPSPFANWSNGIDTVTRGIARGRYYFTQGKFTAASIYYTPGQTSQYCMAGHCAEGLDKIDHDLRSMGGNPSNVRFPADCKNGRG